MTSFRLSEAQSGLRAQFMLGREQLRIGQDSAPILRFFASKGDEKEGMDETRQSSREEGSSRGEEAAQTGGERSHGSGSSGSRTETGSQAETSYQKVVSSIPKALRGLASEIKAVLMPQDKYELQSHAIERDDRPPADPNAPTDLVVSKTKHEVPRCVRGCRCLSMVKRPEIWQPLSSLGLFMP